MRLFYKVLPALVALPLLWALSGSEVEVRRPQGPGAVPEGLREQYEAMLDEHLASIPKEESKAVRAEMAGIYKERTAGFLHELDNGGFLFGHPLNDLVDGVMATMLEQWPELQGKVRVFVARDPLPNALSMGEGTIIVNLGLLERFETEAQLAFVLGHELAHYGMDHSGTDLYNYARALHDKEFAKQLKAILRSSYNRLEQLGQLMLGFALDKRRHGRAHEFEADSMGFVLLARTPYLRSAGASSMDVLEASDQEPYPEAMDYDRVLGAHEVYDPEWMNPPRRTSMGREERQATALDDSLRTHPHCARRRQRLEERMEAMGGDMGVASLRGEDAMRSARLMARHEIIDLYLFAYRPAPAMYRALRMLEEHPDDAYCQAVVGISLASLYHFQSKRIVGKVLDTPHPLQSESYNKLLHWLADVRLKDLSSLGYAWMAAHRNTDTTDPEMLLALALTSHVAGQSEEAKAFAERYNTAHPEGRHTKMLKIRLEAKY